LKLWIEDIPALEKELEQKILESCGFKKDRCEETLWWRL